MKFSLSNRLFAVALLGVFTCALALYGLVRILQLTVAARHERARDAVTTELALMRRDGPNALHVSTLGMRGGYVTSEAAFDTPHPEIDEPTRRALGAATHAAARTHDAALGDGDSSDSVVVVGVAPTSRAPELDTGVGAPTSPTSSYAWIIYAVRPPQFLGVWRFITASLTVATLLLVATAISTVVSVRRGARALNASLEALALDLASPVPRPPVPELADLADHIEGLAGALARAQEDRARLGTELAQGDRLAALGRVAAGVAHEVRNPLASIKLRVDLGRMRADTPDQLARELASVSEEVTRLDRLVADLLVVAGRRSCSRSTSALGALVAQRAALLAPWAGERGVQLEVSGDATCPLDADAVARAVDNLVRNAVEAAPDGSAVEVLVLEEERTALVRVRDRGRGVDAARAHELFEPFFTTKPEGTGLGLALSRAIAAAHGGTLTYARDDGVTCFELTLPLGPGRTAGGHPAAAPPRATSPSVGVS